jgi:HEAT repeat protein
LTQDLDEYRRADFGDKESWPALDDAYRNRIALEFEIIREGRIEALREAARDPDRYVRAFAVAALGILGDRASEEAIAKLIEDPRSTPWWRARRCRPSDG